MAPQGCLGCKFARKEITYFQGHNDHCRKRFLELSNEPGNEELTARMDKSFERPTRKHLERAEAEESNTREKRAKTQDT